MVRKILWRKFSRIGSVQARQGEITKYLPEAVPLSTPLNKILDTRLSPDSIKFLEISEKWENLTGSTSPTMQTF